MKWKKIENRYVISIGPGEKIIEQLNIFIEKEGIKNCSIVGIGACDWMDLAHYCPTDKDYTSQIIEKPMEIANLTGNAFLVEGKPFVHLHITAGNKNFETLSGHLNDARISAACEIVLTVLNSKIGKKFSEEIGLNLLDL